MTFKDSSRQRVKTPTTLFLARLPHKTETLFLRDMVDGDLLEQSRAVGRFPGPEHVYLESHFDLLGQRALREHGLHLNIGVVASNIGKGCYKI